MDRLNSPQEQHYQADIAPMGSASLPRTSGTHCWILSFVKYLYFQGRARPLTCWRLRLTRRPGSSSAGTPPPSHTLRTGSSTGNNQIIILRQSLD